MGDSTRVRKSCRLGSAEDRAVGTGCEPPPCPHRFFGGFLRASGEVGTLETESSIYTILHGDVGARRLRGSPPPHRHKEDGRGDHRHAARTSNRGVKPLSAARVTAKVEVTTIIVKPACFVVTRASWHHIGFAPGVPHLANLPFAFLQRTGFGCAAAAHLMNLPLASRHGAASAGVDSSAIEAAANMKLRIMGFPSADESAREMLCRATQWVERTMTRQSGQSGNAQLQTVGLSR